MAAGVSPISPVTSASPADRTQFAATAISPAVPKAIAHGGTLAPQGNPMTQNMSPAPPPDPTSGSTINVMA